MRQVVINHTVADAAKRIRSYLQDKSFTLFADIDHQKNADTVDLTMPASRVLIFGNPVAGTKLMQKDITMSLDLPLRIAIVEKDGKTLLLHQTTEDYTNLYQVIDHPVLEKMEALFTELAAELS
jgi:uncharacterized protein (DUF302 family)